MAIENLEQLEKSVGLEPGKLAEMISSEDTHKLDLDNLIISNKNDYEARLENIKKETKTAAVEIAVKNARNELGLEFEGKTMENLLNNFKNKIESESKVAPEKKYSDLHKDFESLQGVSKSWEDKYMSLENTYKQKENQRQIDNSILKSIPDNTILGKDDILALIKAKTEFNVGDNGLEIIKDGVVQKNQATLNLLSTDEYVSSFVTPYLKTAEGGAGGKDSNTKGNETSLDLFDKRMEAKGINIGSEGYNEEMSKAIKEGTLKF